MEKQEEIRKKDGFETISKESIRLILKKNNCTTFFHKKAPNGRKSVVALAKHWVVPIG